MLKMEEVRRITCGAYATNAYLLCPEGRTDALLIDPGDDLPALESTVAQSKRSLAGILLTHGHFDHMLAAQPLADETGAPVYVHPADAAMLADAEKSSYNAQVSALPQPQGLATLPYPAALNACGLCLTVLPTPGHSAGSVCLYDREAGLLFSGDTMFRQGFGRTDLFGGSYHALCSSLMQLLTLPEETIVLPGHGDATSIALERRRYRR